MYRISRLKLIGLFSAALMASGAGAQTYTTAAEVKPILSMTKPNWIAVREWEGADLIYFTNALSWRCGVTEIRYGVNGAVPDQVLAMEPCYETEAAPNALKMDGGILPYITLPLGSVQTVSVLMIYDDGTEEPADYARAAVLIP